MGGYFDPYDAAPLPMKPRRWKAPLCRTGDEHREVEHDWESLAKLGKVCACECHRSVAATAKRPTEPEDNGRTEGDR